MINNKKKILVTGGAGYIGSNLIENLKKNQTIVVDNLSTGRISLINKKILFYKIDLKNKKKIEKILNKNTIETVFHLAASLNVKESQVKPVKYYSNNVDNTNNLIELCKKYKVKYFIFSSTCAIFGNKNKKISENMRINPVSVYAKTKAISEKSIIKKFKNTNTKYAILRYFNVAGANMEKKRGEINDHDHLLKNYSRQFLKKKPIFKIYGNNYNTKDGTCIRDYIHIKDLIKIKIKTLNYLKKNKKNLILNCGYGNGLSVLDIYKTFKKLNPKLPEPIFLKRRSGDPARAVANNNRLTKILNFKPRYNNSLKIIKNSINWEKFLLKSKPYNHH